tara:strand:- start:341 stop:595 length:255 start_codon:yes stop_codon:yes gene_type:complete
MCNLNKKGEHIVKKKETKSKKKKNHIEVNGKRIRFLSPDSSIYKNDSTIILFGRRHSQPNNDPKSKFEEFISRAPISFDNGEEE